MSTTTNRKPTVLLAEHQALIGMWLEDELVDAGYAVDGPHGTCEAALEAFASARPDYAVVSVDLSQGPCFALACALRRADVPFVLFSSVHPVLPAFGDVPLLDRPCLAEDFVASLPKAGLANRGRTRICPNAELLAGPSGFALDQCPPACGG